MWATIDLNESLVNCRKSIPDGARSYETLNYKSVPRGVGFFSQLPNYWDFISSWHINVLKYLIVSHEYAQALHVHKNVSKV